MATGTTADRTTLARLFWDRAATSPDDVAYRHPVRSRSRVAWEDVTWSDARDLVEPLAAGLVGLGVEPGDRVAVVSRTRIDWVLAHLAILCAGATTVAVDPGCPPSEVARLVDGSGVVVVLAEDLDQVEKLRRVRGDIRTVRKVVLFDGDHPDRRVMTFEALLSQGEEVLARDSTTTARRVDALVPDATATVLHVPGPTGTPDAVELTHAAWVAEGATAAGRADRPQLLRTPLTEHAGHVLLAAQLTRGQVTEVDAREVDPDDRLVVDPRA